MRIFKIFIVASIAILCDSIPANTQTIDTLSIARTFISNKQYQEADELLTIYTKKDRYSYQLQAQVNYWLKNYEGALDMYKNGIELYPDYFDLRLDYGRILFQLGKLRQAEEQLKYFVLKQPQHFEATLMLGYLSLWKGNVAQAKKIVSDLDKSYPNNTSLKQLSAEVSANGSGYIKGETGYLSDDQPLQATKFNIEAQAYHSAVFSPYLSATTNQFITASKPAGTTWVSIGNTFRSGFGSTIKTEAGLYAGINNTTHFTGSFGITQKLSKILNLNFSANKIPYQFTPFSVLHPFTYSLFNSSIEVNKHEKYLGKAGIELQAFNDANTVTTRYAWLMLPVVTNKILSIKTGYSFSYSNAVKNTYHAKITPTTLRTYPVYGQINGVYEPYFTPQNQQIHSVLATARLSLSKKVTVNAKGNIGIVASASNPVLMLYKKTDTDYSISKSYYKQKYTPAELEASLQIAVNPKININARYNYSSLFFYTRNNTTLQFTYRFIHGKYN